MALVKKRVVLRVTLSQLFTRIKLVNHNSRISFRSFFWDLTCLLKILIHFHLEEILEVTWE